MGYDNSQLGGEISLNQSLTIGATSVLVSPFKRRRQFSITNTSTGGQIISIALDNFNLAVAGSGIPLQPNQTYIESTDNGYRAWSGNINVIASAAGGTIAFSEVAQ